MKSSVEIMIEKAREVYDVGANLQGSNTASALTPQIVEKIINEAISEADPNDFDEPIYWGSLACTNVVIGQSLNGEMIIIFVEELFPDNQQFKDYLLATFKERSKWRHDVKIIFEW